MIAFLVAVLPIIGSVLFIVNEVRKLMARRRAERDKKTPDGGRRLDWDTDGVV